ncbi:cytochrome c oxidase subunit 3 [Buchnera aphidicola]|uniref:cytochrome c oxidase subunit 3 n=1 Tax=Buchnera aphidicola TaxID=9 RepID=UPI00094C16DA|nr:cytochrome c oxidase subunit 3 [Buchnera aphidicola]
MSEKQKKISYSLSNNLNIFGFWIYLMSDCIVFSILFIVYIIMLRHGYDGFLRKNHLFSQTVILAKSLVLLFSSVSCSLAKHFFKTSNKLCVLFFLFTTFILGCAFIGIEYFDCIDIFHKGFYPSVNGYFSSFFALLGMHGLHVIFGLLWILVLIFQVLYFGLAGFVNTSLVCISLFWHFIDIIWILLMICVYFQ